MSQIKVDSIVPRGGLASGVSGGIIQTVQVIKTDTSSFTVPTQSFYDDTNFSASITPTSTSSKILVQMMISHGVSSSHSVSYELRCNGSTVAKGDQDGSNRPRVTASYHNEQPDFNFTLPLSVLHSPSSTSQQTYNLAWRTNSSSNRTHYLNRSDGSSDNYTNFRCVSTIVLQEVTA